MKRCEHQKGLVKWQALTFFFSVMIRFEICALCLEPMLCTGEMEGKSDSICCRVLERDMEKKVGLLQVLVSLHAEF